MRTQQKSHTATKNADSSGHCLNFSTLSFGVSLPTDRPGVSILTDSLPLFSGLTDVLCPSPPVSQVSEVFMPI